MKKSKRHIKYIIVHCTATKEGRNHTARDIDLWHRHLGWRCIGYNYVVKLDGTIEEGRDVDLIPSHAKGYNSNSIGVVYVGGLDAYLNPKDTRTKEQKESLIKLLKELKRLYPYAKILGHRDLPNVKKACPCFDAKGEYKGI